MPSIFHQSVARWSALLGVAMFSFLAHQSSWANKPSSAPMFSTDAERCILPAAQYHRVNQYILRAILKVESNLNPHAIGRNDNGTLDVGIGQMNSMHFKELQRHGVTPSDLRDACIGTYVAAWHLSKVIARHGNTWRGIAAYHSTTPYFNNRYQILLNNEMVRSGAMDGKILPVPPLRPGKVTTTKSPLREPKIAQAESPVVFDSNQ
jgi:soluble lytic murein transglycosylase-like protein